MSMTEVSPSALSVHYPPPALQNYIDYCWFYPGYAVPHPYEQILPWGSVELQFSLNDNPLIIYNHSGRHCFKGGVISGGYHRPFYVETSCPTDILCVLFKPGAAPFLTGYSAAALSNQHIELSAILGPKAALWSEQLKASKESGGIAACFRLLESLLASLFEKVNDAHSLQGRESQLLRLLSKKQMYTSANLRLLLQCSAPTLSKLYDRYCGVPPRQQLRLYRMQRALYDMASNPQKSFVSVALDNGFYDQSHFNRDFIQMLGFTPGAYRPQQVDHFLNLPHWTRPNVSTL